MVSKDVFMSLVVTAAGVAIGVGEQLLIGNNFILSSIGYVSFGTRDDNTSVPIFLGIPESGEDYSRSPLSGIVARGDERMLWAWHHSQTNHLCRT